MTAATISTRLAQLFREAGAAHHAAFAATNGEDPDWPDWYAAHLAGPLGRLLGAEVSRAALASELRSVDQAQRAATSKAHWSEYYAAWFLERYPGAD